MKRLLTVKRLLAVKKLLAVKRLQACRLGRVQLFGCPVGIEQEPPHNRMQMDGGNGIYLSPSYHNYTDKLTVNNDQSP